MLSSLFGAIITLIKAILIKFFSPRLAPKTEVINDKNTNGSSMPQWVLTTAVLTARACTPPDFQIKQVGVLHPMPLQKCHYCPHCFYSCSVPTIAQLTVCLPSLSSLTFGPTRPNSVWFEVTK